MATLTKYRARKPLADDRVSFSWGSENQNEIYTISISNEDLETHFRLNLTKSEALSFAKYVAQRMTREAGDYGLYKKKTDKQALVDLSEI